MDKIEKNIVNSPKYSQVYSFASLFDAFKKARKAKRGKGGEPAFYFELEDNLLNLSDQLQNKAYKPDPYRYFNLTNKKERVVSEASFRDRVVHHSLVSALEPTFESGFYPHSYACRKGKGSHKAVHRVHKLSKQFPYFLKMDVKKYFETADHQVLMSLLKVKIKDNDLLWLCKLLLDGANVPTCATEKFKGLPIGNLTSQFWANVYLDPLDDLIQKFDLKPSTYTRYMDDILIFAHNKRTLFEHVEEIKDFTRNKLQLTMKDEATIVAPVLQGIPWLGFRVFPGTIRLDADGKRRFIKKIKASMHQTKMFKQAEDLQVASAASLCGHVQTGNTLKFRQKIIINS